MGTRIRLGGLRAAHSGDYLLPIQEIVITTASNLFHPLAYTVEREILCALAPEYREKDDFYEIGLAIGAREHGGDPHFAVDAAFLLKIFH